MTTGHSTLRRARLDGKMTSGDPILIVHTAAAGLTASSCDDAQRATVHASEFYAWRMLSASRRALDSPAATVAT